MRDIHKSSKAAVVATLQSAAKKFNVSLDTKNVAIAMSQDAVIANAALQNAAKVKDNELRNGAELLFIYIAPPRNAKWTTLKQKIRPGFYLIRVVIGKDDKGSKAVLLDQSRREVISLPIRTTPPSHGRPRMFSFFGVSVSIDSCSAGVDYTRGGVTFFAGVVWC
jgi:hypothetical protein